MSDVTLSGLLRSRYPAENGYACLFEVGNATGAKCRRHADAIVISLWPSRGLEITGFEFKESRADWLTELKQPEKANGVMQYCDRWYLLTRTSGIAKRDELPINWGWMTIQDASLKTKVAAPALMPIPLDRHFVAALGRRMSESSVDKSQLDEAYRNGHKFTTATVNQQIAVAVRGVKTELDNLRLRVSGFEEASGIRIDGWDAGRIGETVRKYLQGHYMPPRESLDRMAEAARRCLKIIEDCQVQEDRARSQEMTKGE